MNLLWIGAINWLTDTGYVLEAHTAGAVSSSAFEQAIINGLEKNGHNVRIMSDMDNDRGRRFEWSHDGKSHDVCISGISTKYVRLLYKSIQLKKELAHNKELLDSIDAVLIYSVHIPYFSIINDIKRLNSTIKTILICPDLSEYMDPAVEAKSIKKFLKKIESKYTHKKMGLFDGYVWFSKQMGDFFKITDNSVVVEGVCSSSGLDLKSNVKKKQYVMYAGSLSRNFGLQNLMDAFSTLGDLDLELWIFGTGELEEEIIRRSSQNSKIVFKGFIPRKDLFMREREAMLLINVRDPKETYTKYSFPSKTFEYMLSGTPFMTTKLEGIPEEYSPYLIYIDNNKPEVISDAIRNIYDMPETQRNTFGYKARQFVLEKKNATVQAKKIEGLLNKVTHC